MNSLRKYHSRFILLAMMASGIVALGLGQANAQNSQKEVRIVTEGGFVPWNYTKPDGTLAGFEIDLARNLCDRMQVKCTITAQSFDSMIPALNAGKYDAIMDDLAVTPKREESIAFSIPYATLCYTFATLKGSDVAKKLPLQDRTFSLSDAAASEKALGEVRAALSGKVVGTIAAGTSVEFANTHLKGISIRQYKTQESRDLDLVAGRVDAVLGSKDSLIGTAAKPGNENMVLAGACFAGGVVGQGSAVGLRKGDTQLKAMFDQAIRAAKADGTIKRLSEPTFHMDVTPTQ
ncbi:MULTISPECIES: transporter substrate-binding domain-containing protein [Paraburkholderia]|uniref:Transporter substrate-binding domain-containing protein n=1 Tax=Paraburkholderia podalyriae TaxID=1938811 RepID=A0ABR7Q004_9BURK|nr:MULTISPECIES: transporter substrate-binding domain-containing protein [Paraburkholderia]MBC8751870.1 transporter substrate-binding domain-containing protein [Paraburkholderia podalyriae]